MIRRTTGCIHLDYKRKLDIMMELSIQTILAFMEYYRSDWKNHVLC
jgi:hypothetical protein